MALFVLHCLDAEDALPRRMEARPAHLDYVRAQGAAVKLAGPLFAADGTTIAGSLFVLDMPDRAAVDAFISADPYTAARVFGAVQVNPWTVSVGTLA